MGAVDFLILTAGKTSIYGAKGYRYAYSWYGSNAKPIELELIKEDNKWKVE